MITDEEVSALLARMEDETLDFKATAYDLSTEDGRLAVVKDVICMANTPRSESAYIVSGVKKHPDGTYDLRGVLTHHDDATLQSQFTERVYPIPILRYHPIRFRDVELGILEVPVHRSGPSAPIRDFGGSLRQWQIYFRRGSKNDVATPADQARIHRWFSGDVTPPHVMTGTAWDQLLELTSGYSSQVAHILVLTARGESLN